MFEAIGGFIGAFFLFGGFWFWILAFTVFGGLVALSDHEENFWAGVLSVGFLLGIFHFNSLVINWSLIPWIVLIYLGLGVVMSFIKWITFLKIRASTYADYKIRWYEKYGRVNELPPIEKETNMKAVLDTEQYDKFARYLKEKDFLSMRNRKIIPQWQDKYKQLVSWTLWWPAVIFWSVLNDHIMGLVRTIVKSMRGWYDGIAKKVFSNVGVTSDDDMEY